MLTTKASASLPGYYYLGSLEKTQVLRHECVDQIAKTSLLKEFKEMRGDTSPEAIWDFCTNRFQLLMQEKLVFILKLETASNLWPALLISNSSSVGLDCSLARDHAAKLKGLVTRRNDIAHGQKMMIRDLDEYQAYENAAIVVMHELAISVLEALESRCYLAEDPKSA